MIRKNEALNLEEKAVKRHNIEAGIEKEEKPTEKKIDGDIWVRKDNVIDINEAEIEAQLRVLIEKVKKGRNDQETVDVLRPIIKKIFYPLESKEPRS